MILGVVAARAGSKGLPGKNTRSLLGKPLIHWSIEQALACPLIDEVVVTTDCELDAPPASPRLLYVDRPPGIATDKTSKWEVWQHALAVCSSPTTVEAVIDVDVTRPLRTSHDIAGCVSMFQKNDADVVIAIARTKHNPYFDLLQFDVEGNLRPSKHTQSPVIRRQDTPPVFQHAGIYVVSQGALAYHEYLFDGKTLGYEIPWERSLSIDDIHDWRFVEQVMCNLVYNPAHA